MPSLAPLLKSLAPLLKFFSHTAVGSATFGVITLPAVALDHYMSFLGTVASRSVTFILGIGEYSLLAADLALFLIFVVKALTVAGKEIWHPPTQVRGNHEK